MDTAKCSLDEQVYTAWAFSRLDADEREDKRHHLICLGSGCGARAFYRRGSRDGRGPCFGSNEHVIACDAANWSTAGVHGGWDDPVDQWSNIGDLHINLDPAPTRNYHHDPGMPPVDGRTTPRFVGRGGDADREATSQRRLRPLLRELIRSPALATSAQLVHCPGLPTRPAHLFFRAIPDVTSDDAGRLAGYWGTVLSAKRAAGALWLNFGPRQTASIMVPGERISDFLMLAGADDEEGLPGGSILILSQCRRASISAKLYLPLPKIPRCAWIPYPSA
jgi:hypothetical protein